MKVELVLLSIVFLNKTFNLLVLDKGKNNCPVETYPEVTKHTSPLHVSLKKLGPNHTNAYIAQLF